MRILISTISAINYELLGLHNMNILFGSTRVKFSCHHCFENQKIKYLKNKNKNPCQIDMHIVYTLLNHSFISGKNLI